MPDNNNPNELLLLNATQQLECTNPNQWNAASNDSVKTFIDSIETSIGTDKEALEKYRTMISGVPSPWARVTITRKALALSPRNADNVLSLCYKTFKSEWRGLMAAYVLRSDSFEFSEPIPLVGPNVVENLGEMSVLETYGEMLFDDQPLWTLKREKMDRKKNPPCIQILYFKNAQGERIPVGATSPFTFLFSSINYDLSAAVKEIKWIDNDGKFVDPTSGERNYLDDEEKRRLHAFLVSVGSMIKPSEGEMADPNKYYLDWLTTVINANENFYLQEGGKGKALEGFRQAIDNFRHGLKAWADEIARSLKEVNPNVPINTPRPQGPLAILLNSEKDFYLSEATLFTTPDDGRVMIKSSEIFNDVEYIAAWRISEDKDLVTDSCAYYLRAENQPLFLALPFTEKALSVFENAIAQIMLGTEDISLSARCVADNQVEIKMYACLDKTGTKMPVCQKTYRVEVVRAGKVFTWPNFYSEEWQNYYYYSEFPTNDATGICMIPQYKDGPKFTKEEREISTNKDCYLVRYPVNQVDASAHKYEIIRTKQRVNSVQVWINKGGNDVLAGTLLMRKDKYITPGNSPRPAVVGIDFGSTNTCAYYRLASGGGDPTPVPFSNRRMAIVGFDNKPKELAEKDELLFISNEEPVNKNGQVKSWLHDHNLLYLAVSGGMADVNRIRQEIVGGIPVNESNISVRTMDRYAIQTNAGTLYYNMKWLAEEKSLQRKTSFLRMLWLQICADLYAIGMVPSKLNWSFPSAMSSGGRMDLRGIFSDIVLPCPFKTEYDITKKSDRVVDFTEAEADCAYSLKRGDTVDRNQIVLGIDVGGSTSDILIFGFKNGPALLTQSSVRIASSFFFDAIKSSSRFRISLKNFHDSRVIPDLKVLDIDSITSPDPDKYDRAPYFLNNVFDQLQTDTDFRLFYRTLNTDVRPIFALPAYVTGMLVFYCGMLVRNAIEKNGLVIKNVTLRHYGKGGRLFEWITDIYERLGMNYYRKCFQEGLGEELAQSLTLTFGDIYRQESKSEVAFGLVSDNIETISSGPKDKETGNRIIENYDIVGEEDVEYVTETSHTPVDAQSVIPLTLFKDGINAEFSSDMKRFSKFMDIFIKFVGEDTNILRSAADLRKGMSRVNVTSFILSDPEYIRTKAEGYRQPVIVVEALDYLNKVLLPLVSKEIEG